jgi:ketosteroid isomerase-like protein
MDTTRRFLEALNALECDWNTEEIVSLFSDHCDVGNIVSPNVYFGREGAREYWSVYRNWFGEVQTSIHRVIYSERHSAIEWSSRGTTSSGILVSYEGVSILEFETGRISRFRAYFNPAQLSRAVRPAHPIAHSFEAAFS